MALRVIPVTFDEARRFVAAFHRHHGPPAACRITCGVADEAGILRGVAIAGYPVARVLHDRLTLEVTRTCTDGTPNANSMLYAAIWRAARALGYTRLLTYTQDGESGSSLRAAGWRVVAAVRPRPGLPYPAQDFHGRVDGISRTRWEAPGSAASGPLPPMTLRVTPSRNARCPSCEALFLPLRADARYCSPRCRQAAYRTRTSARVAQRQEAPP